MIKGKSSILLQVFINLLLVYNTQSVKTQIMHAGVNNTKGLKITNISTIILVAPPKIMLIFNPHCEILRGGPSEKL